MKWTILEYYCALRNDEWGQLGSSMDWEAGLEMGGPRLKFGLRHFPAVWPWASHLTSIAYPYNSSALEPIHSIDSKKEGKGLKKKRNIAVTVCNVLLVLLTLFCLSSYVFPGFSKNILLIISFFFFKPLPSILVSVQCIGSKAEE